MLKNALKAFTASLTSSARAKIALDQGFLAVLSVVIITIILWGIKSYEDQYIETATTKISTSYINALEKSLNQSLYSIDRMADRWLVRGGTPEPEWRQDATAYILHQDELIFLRVVGVPLTPWQEPQADVERFDFYAQAVNQDFHDAQDKTTLANAFHIEHNERGQSVLYYFSPISVLKQSFIASVYDINTLVQSSLKLEEKPYFDISIKVNNNPIFKMSNALDLYEPDKFKQIHLLNFRDQAWIIEVVPTQEFIKHNLVLLPKVGFVLGIGLVLFAVFILYSRQRVRVQHLELIKSERLLTLFIQKAPVSIAMFDIEFKYLSASDRWYDDYNIAQKNIIGLNHFEVFKDSNFEMEPWRAAFLKCLKGESIRVDEALFVQKNGARVWLKYELYPWYAYGRHVGGLIMFSEDITEHKKFDSIKNEFISTVSHELRTPLTSIKGALVLLGSRVATKIDDRSNRLLSISLDSCDRLSKLVDDILDMQKITAGKMDFNFNQVDIHHLLQLILERNAALQQKYQVKFHFISHAAGNVECWLDPYRFEQVITNLLSNAAKFSPRESSVTITLSSSGTHALISVRDEGRGIEDEFKARIFERFSQEDSSDTRSHEGTGLGLHISKNIVEAFQGSISFESSLGEGTTFFVQLPLMQKQLAL
ncbi:MAG: hypothetical protein CMD81_07440 [Gammaproteobacteria bacterium]|nr:hypothetical protein [Gammaproteobacteria bacterium]|tara:strand:+ start:357 stop:2315 length:1959 start_codon:yes stop_codon:yes gene_type:complete